MNASCPHCKGITADIVMPLRLSGGPFDISKCKNCSHLYTWINEEVNVDEIYSSGAYKLDDQRNSVFFKIQKYEYLTLLKKVLSFIKNQGSAKLSLLDFGCGKGHFLYFSRLLNFEVYGVETAAERAAFAREKYNFDVNESFYTGSGKINNMDYDVIVLLHVLEHINEPELIVSDLLNDNLKKNGILVIEVPNINSWQSKIGGANWLHLDVPRHLSHYSDQYLSAFINKLKGRVVKKETFSLHLGIIGMLQALMSPFGYRGSLIEDLKFNRTNKLMISIMLLLLPAFLLEFISSIFQKGGVLRFYITK